MKILRSSKLTKAQQHLLDVEWERYDRQSWYAAYVEHEYGKEYYFQAIQDDQLVAVAHCYIEGGVVNIDEFLVFEAYRGKGIGTALMQHVIAYAQSKRQHKLYLETDPTSRAVQFYHKFGFFEEARLKNHFGHADGIIMSLFLA